jgi:predicted  nucleic acid-binding Zn-ribbon protein
MEDKSFDLLTKMYKEFTEFREEIKLDVQKVSNQIVRLENELKPEVEATLDGYKQLAEGQQEIKEQLSDISKKVTNQEVEITV